MAEGIVSAIEDRKEAARVLAKAIGGWLPADEDAEKVAAEYVERIAPLVHGTGAQYKSLDIDRAARRAAKGEMPGDEFMRIVGLSIPESRQGDAEKIAEAALEKARSGIGQPPGA